MKENKDDSRGVAGAAIASLGLGAVAVGEMTQKIKEESAPDNENKAAVVADSDDEEVLFVSDNEMVDPMSPEVEDHGELAAFMDDEISDIDSFDFPDDDLMG